jgi:hypothetical protein
VPRLEFLRIAIPMGGSLALGIDRSGLGFRGSCRRRGR